MAPPLDMCRDTASFFFHGQPRPLLQFNRSLDQVNLEFIGRNGVSVLIQMETVCISSLLHRVTASVRHSRSAAYRSDQVSLSDVFSMVFSQLWNTVQVSGLVKFVFTSSELLVCSFLPIWGGTFPPAPMLWCPRMKDTNAQRYF